MSKSLIVYFSQSGTTAQVAQRIAAGLQTAGYQVDLCNMKDEQPPPVGSYQLLGIGSPVYYYRPPFNVTDYVKSLPSLNGLPAFVFMLHGTYRFDAGTAIRRILSHKGALDVGCFHCRGADLFMGYLKEGYLFSSGHPTTDELAHAETFGSSVAAHVAGRQYVRPEDDWPPSVIYRLERFLTGRWLTKHIYSRLFRLDAKKCDACGLCVELCPTGNITQREGRRLVWGRNCLLCLTCELKCPKGAILSPASWSLFRPFMIYNVRSASRDPSIDYARVVYSHGSLRKA
jgi:flavodoxin/ferredoxin